MIPQGRHYHRFLLEQNSIHELAEPVRRGYGSGYVRGLMGKCSEAHKMLFRELLTLTQGQIRPLEDDPEEDPLQVKDEREIWDEDESPLSLLKLVKESEKTRQELVDEINRSRSQGKNGIVKLTYRVYVICVRLPEAT